VSFNSGNRAAHISTIAEDAALSDRFNALQTAMQQGGDIAGFCHQRSAESTSVEEQEAWAFMKVLLSDDCHASNLIIAQMSIYGNNH